MAKWRYSRTYNYRVGLTVRGIQQATKDHGDHLKRHTLQGRKERTAERIPLVYFLTRLKRIISQSCNSVFLFFFFFGFWKNMTFGYCFSPSGPKLATGWNGLKPSWLNAFFFGKLCFLAKD